MRKVTRRSALKTLAAGAASIPWLASSTAAVSRGSRPPRADGPSGRSPRFSFDEPDPWTPFEGYRFAFRVYTERNVYFLDPENVTWQDLGRENWFLRCKGFRGAGGMEPAPGAFLAAFNLPPRGDVISWWIDADHEERIVGIASLVEGLPRGEIAPYGSTFQDPGEEERLFAFPPSSRHLGDPIRTAAVLLKPETGPVLALYNLDGLVRPKRIRLRPSGEGMRLEGFIEPVAKDLRTNFRTTAWRIAKAEGPDQALAEHLDFMRRVHRIPPFEERDDVPPWARSVALVLHLHGMHPTGRVFLDYRHMLEALKWVAERFPADRTLAILAGWSAADAFAATDLAPLSRHGGEEGFRALAMEARQLGIRLAPRVPLAAASRRDPAFAPLAEAVAQDAEGNPLACGADLDGDGAPDSHLAFLHPGLPAWHDGLLCRIGKLVDDHRLEAILLDGTAAYANDPRAEVFAAVKAIAAALRKDRPGLLLCGTDWYDGTLAVTPLVMGEPPPFGAGEFHKIARAFSPLSHPSPSRGSTGVDGAGFRPFDRETLGLRPGVIPTLALVGDTLSGAREEVEAVLAAARKRAGI